jgi:periplasmic divalent cation tolerance protein
MSQHFLVLVTSGSVKEARRIAEELVRKRLAACVNVALSPVSSVYRWKGKVESAKEYLLLIKTSRKRLGPLEKAIRKLHSYEVPEVIALPIVAGSKRYLRWLEESVSASQKEPSRK